MERGRGIRERVGRLYQRLSGESPAGVDQDPAGGREPERDNPAESMSRLEFRRPHRSKEGMPEAPEQAVEARRIWPERAEEAELVRGELEEREVKEAEDRTGAEAEPPIQEREGSFQQKFAEAERRLEEVEARAKAAEQLAAQAEYVAGFHADEPGQERRTKEIEPQDHEQSSPDTEPTNEAKRAAADGNGINLQTASFEELRELGMSITQALRVLDYRESNGGFSVDDLDRVPGFSRDTRVAIKRKLVV